MIVDGRALAKEILARAKARAEKLPHRPKVVAYTSDPTPATLSYLKIKQRYADDAGCDFKVVTDIAKFSDADAALIQLPLPLGVSNDILNSIPLEKDADVLSSAARALFESGSSTPGVNARSQTPGVFLPPVVAAIKEIFDANKIEVKGKRVVVIGRGFLVGAPAATWLQNQGAEVSVVDSYTEDLAAALRAADIIISGAGVPHLIKPGMLKTGVVLIDAGTSESNGALKGDADPACAAKCSIFTPVPGGVGPIAVACLFANAVELASRQQG